MEEFWEGISLSPTSSPFYPPNPNLLSTKHHHAPDGNVVLQEFLLNTSNTNSLNSRPLPCRPPSPPVTFLSLKIVDNYRQDHELMGCAGNPSSMPSLDLPSERRHKRLMKNREAAVRSRARREAYTFELESKKAKLLEENAKLRRKIQLQEEQSYFVGPVEIPKRASSV
ncbi:hypothetical protein Droror1_Dr00015744 [Drosera rotundifolia]